VPRYSSRTLDADIVLYGDRIVKGPGNLKIPRLELEQAFVLQPLADIAADVVHPVLHETIRNLWDSGAASGDRGAQTSLDTSS